MLAKLAVPVPGMGRWQTAQQKQAGWKKRVPPLRASIVEHCAVPASVCVVVVVPSCSSKGPLPQRWQACSCSCSCFCSLFSSCWEAVRLSRTMDLPRESLLVSPVSALLMLLLLLDEGLNRPRLKEEPENWAVSGLGLDGDAGRSWLFLPLPLLLPRRSIGGRAAVIEAPAAAAGAGPRNFAVISAMVAERAAVSRAAGVVFVFVLVFDCTRRGPSSKQAMHVGRPSRMPSTMSLAAAVAATWPQWAHVAQHLPCQRLPSLVLTKVPCSLVEPSTTPSQPGHRPRAKRFS